MADTDFLPEGNDAWKQHYVLLEQFTREWDVRPDLGVTAHGCDRCVELSLAYPKHDESNTLEMVQWHTTKRNVSTMRELAAAIVAACDFVDESNPVWAEHHSPMLPLHSVCNGFAIEDDCDLDDSAESIPTRSLANSPSAPNPASGYPDIHCT